MPPAIIAALIAAGTTVGVTAYNHVSAPGQPAPPSPAEVTKNAIASEQAKRTSAASAAGNLVPGLQANTDGGLSPDAYKQLSYQLSGNAQYGGTGFAGAGSPSFTGNNGFGNPNPAGGPPGISNSPQMAELLKHFLDGGGSNSDPSTLFNGSGSGASTASYGSPGLVT